jgi:pimeloyl-ACP methyl ester carboxylesterase
MALEPRALRHVAGRPTELPGGLVQREHSFTCPLDWRAKHGAQSIDVFVRELVLAKHGEGGDKLPCLIYLQGGPGFPAPRPSAPPSGWLKAALSDFRVLLLDQRGVGRSTPATVETLAARGDAEAQAAFLSHMRADSIVHDCEAIRFALCGPDAKVSLLGQSFGGFCALTYLSLYPRSLERVLLTCGLAPVGQPASAVYRKTFARMAERNRRFFAKYPEHLEQVRLIVQMLHRQPVPLPGGGTLTARRFLQLGLLLGSSSGFEALHQLLEAPFLGGHPLPPQVGRGGEGGAEEGGAEGAATLSREFLKDVELRQAGFETNPIYFALHEPGCYADGGGQPTAWAAERVLREELRGSPFDWEAALSPAPAAAEAEAAQQQRSILDGAHQGKDTSQQRPRPIYFSGEMVFSWMCEDYADLRALKGGAELLAHKADWPPLFDEAVLRDTSVPVAALIAYDDIYVEREFSERVARLLGDKCSVWISNQFAHSGLRDDPTVFSKLLEMSKGEGGIPC